MSNPNPVAPRVSLARVLMPTEHGGWAFLGEPVLLGLLAAPSVAGALVGLASLAGFLARQPLRLAAGDRRRGKRYPRTVLAERAFAACVVVATVALAAAVALARGPVAWALVPAAPFAAAALALDLGRRSRDLAAELAAVLALGAVAAAMALAAGWAAAPALGLWGVLAARGVPSVLVVRARLRRDRGERAHGTLAILASLAGAGAGAALAATGSAPWSAAAALALLAVRAAWMLSPARPRWSTPRLGVAEVVAGLVVVLATAFGRSVGR